MSFSYARVALPGIDQSRSPYVCIAGVAHPWTCCAAVINGRKLGYSEGRKLLKIKLFLESSLRVLNRIEITSFRID
jgi:hypothetical protein